MLHKNAYSINIGKPEINRPIRRLRYRWEDNIDTDVTKIGSQVVDWIPLAQWTLGFHKGLIICDCLSGYQRLKEDSVRRSLSHVRTDIRNLFKRSFLKTSRVFFVLKRSRVRISDRRSSILTDNFRSCPQFRQANISTLKKSQSLPYTYFKFIVLNNFFIQHSMKSVVKETKNQSHFGCILINIFIYLWFI